ncbi:ABC transporter substrate-binding protein [Acanthopleuribacter pedis]|uniref:ABC transporter substrate-binding protein n=1 Tax=Acanthopleuribacter pedis TaxID=442870 RepID=A0A8J7QFA6_9BACT|nr:ABC transporter substrate-binding protein [Acanthopleuribacter pedis]MBO1323244.1 ABC transporter substrate-binding protein [Acanthopleuribacter pedis]
MSFIHARRVLGRRNLHITMSLLLGCALFACGGLAPTDTKAAEGQSDSIRIGAAWPLSSRQDQFREGIQLAADELNRGGGVLGRKVELVFADDEGTVRVGKLVAQRFAEKEQLDAVIGHFDSHIAIAASVTYAFHNLLFISPGATNPKLTRQGFSKVFRTCPSDTQAGAQLADIAQSLGYRQLVVVHEQSRYGGELANAIEFRAGELDLEITARISYSVQSGDLRLLMERLELVEFDAVFFAGEASDAARFIRTARAEGFSAPFLGGYGLDNPELFSGNHGDVEDTLVLSVFHGDNPNPYVQSFNLRFQEAYGRRPDAWAAQGYDALIMLAHGIRMAQSTEDAEVAKALHAMNAWYGVTGTHRFDAQGDVLEKAMVPKIAKNGNLAYFER